MGRYMKIHEISLHRLNKAEYTNFLSRAVELARQMEAEKIGASEGLLLSMETNLETMKDLVVYTRASRETEQIWEEIQKADKLTVKLLTTISNTCKIPVIPYEAIRTSSESLYIVTKPFTNCHRKPMGQKVSLMHALLNDLAEDVIRAHLETLGLAGVANELEQVVNRLEDLINQRTQSRAANRMEPCAKLRAELDGQYDELVTMAFAMSVVHPSEEASRFVRLMNSIIAETKAAFKQRMAKRKKKEKLTQIST